MTENGKAKTRNRAFYTFVILGPLYLFGFGILRFGFNSRRGSYAESSRGGLRLVG